MLKKKMVGTALCLGILTGGGTLVGNMPAQAAENKEFTVLEGEWELSYLDNSFLIADCRVYLDGYSDKEIMNLLDLKKGDKLQIWVTGDGSIRESYPGQFTGNVFKLRNMTNGKILEEKNISSQNDRTTDKKISYLISKGAISSGMFLHENKVTQEKQLIRKVNGVALNEKILQEKQLLGKVNINSSNNRIAFQINPHQYAEISLKGYTETQIIELLDLKTGDTIKIQYESIQNFPVSQNDLISIYKNATSPTIVESVSITKVATGSPNDAATMSKPWYIINNW